MSRKRRESSRDRMPTAVAPTAVAPLRRRRMSTVVTGLAFLAIASACYWIWMRGSAVRLCHQARASLESDPVAAERLSVRSVEMATGPYPEAMLLRCRALGAMGKWLEAAGGFSLIQHPEQCPQDDLVQLGRAAAAANQWGLAATSFDAARKSGTGSAPLWRLAILVDERRGDLNGVLTACDALAQADPADPYPWQVRARIYQQRGEVLPMTQALREALGRKPAEPEASRLRATLVEGLLGLGSTADARLELDRLLSGGQDISASLRLKNAFLLRLEGHSKAALAEVEQVLQADRQSAQAFFLSGLLHSDLGDPDKAAKDLQQAIVLNPYYKEAHYKLAEVCRRLNRNREADEHLVRSQELTDARVEILHYQELLSRNPDDREAKQRLAALYETVGEPDAAAKWRRAAEGGSP